MKRQNTTKKRNVSSPFLYHFTDNIETVNAILKCQYFLVSSCKERYPFIQKNLIRDINMVCFCDLPCGARASHKKRYGHYAIALKKEWANNHKISPVIYCRHEGRLTEVLKSIYNLDIPQKTKDDLLNYCKPVMGFEYIKKIQEWSEYRVRFYDEREWRYIPDQCKTNLPFSMDDVVKVYVKNETDKAQLHGLIEESKIAVFSTK